MAVQLEALDGEAERPMGSAVCSEPNAQQQTASTSKRSLFVVMRHGRRHDQGAVNWHETAAHPWDPPLSRNGRTEVLQTAENLKQYRFDVLVVSPYLRCLQTAVQILKVLESSPDITIVIDKGLSEVQSRDFLFRGQVPRICDKVQLWIWKLQTAGRFKAEAPALTNVKVSGSWPKMYEDPVGAEPRFEKTFQRITASYPEQNIIVITHGQAVIQSMKRQCLRSSYYVRNVQFGGYSVAWGSGNSWEIDEDVTRGIHWDKIV